jgi:outer membrane lipoprotein-sorting protein
MVKLCFAMIFAFTALTGVKAQTADEIISKHLDAIGGKDKIAALKSVHMESSVQIMGNDAPSTISILDGKGYRFEMDMNGMKIIQVFTNKGGWAISPMGGSTTPQALPDEMYRQGKAQIYVGGPLFNYQAKGSKVEFLGKEDSAYKIKVTTSDSIVINFFIDPTTYLIRKMVQSGNMMGQPVELVTSFSNWKKTDAGILFPYTVELNTGQFTLVTNITKLQTNPDIDPKIFEMPKS